MGLTYSSGAVTFLTFEVRQALVARQLGFVVPAL